MLLIRSVEEALVKASADKLIRGPLHSYVGQELVASSVLSHASSSDLMTSTHRGHGHYLAKGCSLTKLLDELAGLPSGSNKGNGGSMHVADIDSHHYGANGIVGGGVPIACGLALSLKLRESSSVVICFFGDGASNQGVVFESLNIASFMSLPVLFICENNQFAQSTRLSDVSSTSVSSKSSGFGISSYELDTLDPIAFSEDVGKAVAECRTQSTPVLIQANTYRFHRHFTSERPKDIDYIDPHQHSEFLKEDPLLVYSSLLDYRLDQINDLSSNIINHVYSYLTSIIK